MLLKIRHALLAVSDQAANPQNKQSAVLIDNEIIISSASILLSFVRSVKDGDKIIKSLQQCNLVDVQDENCVNADLLRSFNYQVTFERRSRPLADRKTQHNSGHTGHILTRYTALPLFVFNAVKVSRNLHNVLMNADPADQNVLRSSFLVLTIRALKERENYKHLLQHFGSYLRYAQSIHTLDDVMVICSPFGSENFYKTISIGKVSNVMGSTVFGISNALPLGCEGSGVFNSKLRLIGIIVCTSFQRGQENVNLTIAANFSYLLQDFMRQLGSPIHVVDIPRTPSTFSWERTIVVIDSGTSQGTGTFVTVQDKRFILTCAHVVGQLNSEVHCRAINKQFKSSVIWCNPDENRPYDLALLATPDDLPKHHCARLSRNRATLGQTVYNAGFPYFVNFNLKYDFNPSIFHGRIIKCDQGAIMSDGSVQSGQSGGPMFDESGNILGVCVSNLKHDNIVYPNLNTAIPVFDILTTLQTFAQTSDIKILNNLVAKQKVRNVWSLESPAIQQCKL